MMILIAMILTGTAVSFSTWPLERFLDKHRLKILLSGVFLDALIIYLLLT